MPLIGECLLEIARNWRLLDSAAAFCIAVNPVDPAVVWVANLDGGLSRIERRVETQKKTFVVDPGYRSGKVTNLIIDPLDTCIMYAGGVVLPGIYRSEDAGQSWKLWYMVKSKLTWLSGESLVLRYDNGCRRILFGELSRGTLSETQNDGKSWETHKSTLLKSICSIAIAPDDTDCVVLGCRGGVIQRYNLKSRLVESSVSTSMTFSEVPRILELRKGAAILASVTAGFGGNDDDIGLLLSYDQGISWSSSLLPGISLWAIDECHSGCHLVVGGFSEDNRVAGRGLVSVVDIRTGTSVDIGHNIPWIDQAISSVWDIVETKANGVSELIVATVNGTYIYSSTAQK